MLDDSLCDKIEQYSLNIVNLFVLGAGEEEKRQSSSSIWEEEAIDKTEGQSREGCWGEARRTARHYCSYQVLKYHHR